MVEPDATLLWSPALELAVGGRLGEVAEVGRAEAGRVERVATVGRAAPAWKRRIWAWGGASDEQREPTETPLSLSVSMSASGLKAPKWDFKLTNPACWGFWRPIVARAPRLVVGGSGVGGIHRQKT